MNTKTTISMILSLLLFSLGAHADGKWFSATDNGFSGTRNFKVYVPNNFAKKEKHPVVVMLHGCTEDAESFAKGTRIEKWADKYQFIALFPEQSSSYNPYKCWNWVVPTNNSRAGEATAIIDMLNLVIKNYHGDNNRVFAAGMSAGAAMTNILGNCFPERFKALASHDGAQFYSSYIGLDYKDIINNGAAVPAAAAADNASSCSDFIPGKPKKMPIIIFHGSTSKLMSPIHAFQIEEEMKDFNDMLDNGLRDDSYFLRSEKQVVPDSKTYGYTLYKTIDANNEVLIERYMINTIDHAWSGGVAGIPYNDPKGPDASALIFKFFSRFGL
jgi:poly(hydroxyalkanoate) depolymerase family esterase